MLIYTIYRYKTDMKSRFYMEVERMVQEIMKSLVYYDFKEINDGEVSISKSRLEEILNEVYQAGYTDGSNNKSYITTTPWSTTPNITYCGGTLPQPREITSTNPI